MKKKYISPESVTLDLQVENTIALSMTEDTISNESDIRSNEKDMDDWSSWDD